MLPEAALRGMQIPRNAITRQAAAPNDTSIVGDEIQRLMQNRMELLATGVYQEHDDLILQLDERIDRLVQKPNAIIST